jgi:hypothetical protein
LSQPEKILSLSLSFFYFICFFIIQREIECGSFIYFAIGPYMSVMPFYDAVNNSKANAGTFKILAGMQALKYVEQLTDVTHIEPGSIVLHIIDIAKKMNIDADFDCWVGPI